MYTEKAKRWSGRGGTCLHPRTWEEGAGGSSDWGQPFSRWVPGHPELHKEIISKK